MTCEKCGYDEVDASRTGSALITYCQRCGNTTEEKRDPPRERWDHSRPIDIGKGGRAGKGKAINHLIPIPEKRKKQRG